MTDRIERLGQPVSDSDLRQLAELLVETVESGAAVSFLPPLTLGEAEAWWRSCLASADPRAIFLVGRDGEGIAGTVQLHPAWAPNQPHRGEIAKLMVARRRRGSGLGKRLMESIEAPARKAGYRLLTLDTKAGDPAEKLYRDLGWTEAGRIPRFALNPDGTTHDTVIFWKEIG